MRLAPVLRVIALFALIIVAWTTAAVALDPSASLPPRVVLEAISPESKLVALLFRYGAPAGDGTVESALRGHLNGFCKFAGVANKLPPGAVGEALECYNELHRMGKLVERPEWSRAMGDAVLLPDSVERLEIVVDPALPCLYAPRKKRTIRVLMLGFNGCPAPPEEAALALAHEGAHLRREAAGNAYEGDPAMKGRVDPNAHAPDELGTEESATEEGYAIYREMLALAQLKGADGDREVEERYAIKAVRESSHPIRRFEPGYILGPGETEEVRVIPIGEATFEQCLRCEGIVARIYFALSVRFTPETIDAVMFKYPGRSVSLREQVTRIAESTDESLLADFGGACGSSLERSKNETLMDVLDFETNRAATTEEIQAIVGVESAERRRLVDYNQMRLDMNVKF